MGGWLRSVSPFPPVCGVAVVLLSGCLQVFSQLSSDTDFSPSVRARCHRGNMTIVVRTEKPFDGVVHAKDYRNEKCLSYGNGKQNTTVVIDLLANKDDPSYCGVHTSKSHEQSLAIAVRMHRTLELSEDKLYLITCGKTSFKNTRNEFSRVSLYFMENNRKVSEVIYGHQYTLRAALSNSDGNYGIRVKNCLSFSSNASEVNLIDINGCPEVTKLSSFKYNRSAAAADATLYSMFRFPNSNRVHLQCDVILCKGGCEEISCPYRVETLPRALARSQNNASDNVQLMASTSVYVVEPGERIEPLVQCTEWQFPWLIGLCICLAVLLLVMLIVNIILCSSLACTCTKTEIIEKEPSDIEDYDPYKVGWSSSHYGSRSSLNKPPGYASGGSTLNSGSSASDHYAVVHSRPGSRYSHHSHKEALHNGHRGGSGSTLSSRI